MPFLPPNQQRQSTEGTLCHKKAKIGTASLLVRNKCFYVRKVN